MVRKYKKSSDFFLILIRCYGDDKLYKKNETAYWIQHRERAQLFNDFTWTLIELITGKLRDDWYKVFMTNAKDCVLDEIEETTEIHISRSYEGWCRFIIPKKYKFLFNWIQENNTLPIKNLKRLRLHHLDWPTDVLKYNREDSLKYTKELKEKYPQLR